MRKIILLMFTAFLALSVTAQTKQMMDRKQQNIVSIAALTGKGELGKLKTAISDGLDAGMTVNEVKEVLVHTYAYSGFPRALRGLQTLISVMDERKARGIEDVRGREASPITDSRTKYERGRDILTEISGVPADAPKAGYAVLAPEIEVFLKEHLFADIFERDVLTYAERELATVSVLAAIDGVEPMMRSHMNISLHIGITPDQLRHLLSIVEKQIGRSEADAGRMVLNGILQDDGLIIDSGTPLTDVGNGVRTQKITFRNRFLIDLAGDLYLPAGFDSSKKYAAIVVGHPFGGVKEQTAGLHARKLAELGYVTLAFDASYYGESGGYPRRIESPEVRVEDFSAAVDYLSNHPVVNPEQIGVLGICGGGCYSVSAAQIDHRIKAVATISMYDMGRARRQGVNDVMTYEQRMAALDQIGLQRTAEFGGAVRRDIRALPEKVDASTPQYALDFLDYYDNPARGKHPNSTAYYSYTSLAPMMNFFPFAQIETISPRPLLFIAGEKAVSAYFSEDAYQKAAEPKELFVVPGATHVDLYDRPEYLAITLPKLDAFFQQNLMATPSPGASLDSKTKTMETASPKDVFAKGERMADTPNFTGEAWLNMFITTADSMDCTVGNVTFAPGVRNSWHSHPGGQILLCTSGKGYYQEKGKSIQLLMPGDVVKIAPNVIHWHGATPESEFTHMAIGTQTSEGAAVWLEPVTDKEYNNFKNRK